MASTASAAERWFYRFVDADGVQHERKGCPDRRETEAMAAAAELEASKSRPGLIDPKASGSATTRPGRWPITWPTGTPT